MNEEEIVNSYVCLDIETTGLSPKKGAKIIEIGAVKVINGKLVSRFSALINPEQKLPQKIEELTGITNEELKDKEVYGKVLPTFYKFIGNLPVIMHNSKFDWNRFLLHYFKSVGIIAKNRSIDTLAISKRINKDLTSHKLNILADKYNIKQTAHHRAYDDAYVTARIYGMMKLQCNVKYNQDFKQIDIGFDDLKDLKVRKVKYWEKARTKNNIMKRLYVNVATSDNKIFGSVFLDVTNGVWYNQSFQGNIDFEKIEEKVKIFTKCRTTNELRAFRN